MAIKRSIPADFNAVTVSAIDSLLDDIIIENNVFIPHAIESGSRAWGFPSPDSDYDCRFIFVRQRDDYLSPWQKRDVIETPLVGDLDVNGWELGKALLLMLKGNAVILEWLTSPIVYRSDDRFRHAFIDLANRTASRTGLAKHYYNLGSRQWQTYFGDEGGGTIKKLFYVIRPAMALRWLRVNSDRIVPPMHFPTLLSSCDAPADLQEQCIELIAQKAKTREMGDAPVPKMMKEFIEAEYERAETDWPQETATLSEEARLEVEAFFRSSVEKATRLQHS